MKKIVLQLNDDKCRSKALKVAAEAQGVISVSLEGEERNQLVVTGFVDAVCLASMLRKKFGCVTLVSVEEVKKDKDDNKDENKGVCYCIAPCPPSPSPCVPGPSYYVVYDQYPNNCSVM